MDVEVLSLRVFLAVHTHRHFGRAAEELNLSISAVSKHLRRLESVVGAELITRGPDGVGALTAAGVRIVDDCRAIVAAAGRLGGGDQRDQALSLPGQVEQVASGRHAQHAQAGREARANDMPTTPAGGGPASATPEHGTIHDAAAGPR